MSDDDLQNVAGVSFAESADSGLDEFSSLLAFGKRLRRSSKRGGVPLSVPAYLVFARHQRYAASAAWSAEGKTRWRTTSLSRKSIYGSDVERVERLVRCDRATAHLERREKAVRCPSLE
jgi:hypothetical protein